jgi:hypothetical protein
VEQRRNNAAALKAQADRDDRAQKLEIDILNLRTKEKGMDKDDPGRLLIERQIAAKQAEINSLRTVDPSKKPLIDAQNKETKAAAEERIRNEEQQQFKRDNAGKGFGMSLPDPAAPLSQIGMGVEQFAAAVERGSAATRKAIAATNQRLDKVARDMENLAGRVDNQRA